VARIPTLHGYLFSNNNLGVQHLRSARNLCGKRFEIVIIGKEGSQDLTTKKKKKGLNLNDAPIVEQGCFKARNPTTVRTYGIVRREETSRGEKTNPEGPIDVYKITGRNEGEAIRGLSKVLRTYHRAAPYNRQSRTI